MRYSIPRIALAGFAVLVLGTLVVAASTSGTAFGLYNPAWDGTTELRSLGEEVGADPTVIQDSREYATVEPNETVAVVLAPTGPYAAASIDNVSRFLRAGGTLVVAGDVGTTANQLLRGIGSSARIDGVPLRDEQRYGEGPSLPLATNVSDHDYTRSVGTVALNVPASIRETNGTATPLVRTSAFAYRDVNRNETLDRNETLAHYTVVSVEGIGDGDLVVASDPSIFINAMIDRADNRRFVRGILDGHERLALDVSHSESLPPLAALLVLVEESPPLQLAGGALSIALLAKRRRIREALGALSRRVSGREEGEVDLDAAAVRASIRDRHPEWDGERVDRIAQTIMERDGERPDDE